MVAPTFSGARAKLPAPYVALIAVAAATAADVALDPTRNHLPLCPLHSFTGLNCPFCGGLRGAYELAHGRLVPALHDNALFVLALPLLVGFWIDWMVRARRGRPSRSVHRTVVVIGIVVAVVFMVVRNLPIGRALSPP